MTAEPHGGVVVLGAGDLVGEEVLRLLAADGPSFPHVHALDVGAAVGEPLDCGDTRLVVEDAASFDYAHVDVVLSSVDPVTAARCLPAAHGAGCLIVDAGGHFAGDRQVPTVVMGVNDSALDRLAALPARGVMVPPYVVVQALRVLAPLQRRFGLRRVNLVACHPAARAGAAGVERLARESARALNGHGLGDHDDVHGGARGIVHAFAVAVIAGGGSREEAGAPARLIGELLGEPELDIRVTELRVPVFYDCTLALDLELEEGADEAAVRDALASTGYVDAGTEALAAGVDPRLHVPQTTGRRALRLQWLQVAESGNGLSLGTAGDAIRCGVAPEQVGILRRLRAVDRQA